MPVEIGQFLEPGLLNEHDHGLQEIDAILVADAQIAVNNSVQPGKVMLSKVLVVEAVHPRVHLLVATRVALGPYEHLSDHQVEQHRHAIQFMETHQLHGTPETSRLYVLQAHAPNAAFVPHCEDYQCAEQTVPTRDLEALARQ